MVKKEDIKSKKDDKFSNQQVLRMHEQMVRIRIFEDNANQLYLSAKMPGLTHMYSGQEAVAVGICQALTNKDYITSTHRGHGHCIAKGANYKQMFCELLGKKEGYCQGKGGSMHIADQDAGNLGANAIVGGSAGIATGAALTSKYLNKDSVAVCFFGDGALGQGLIYEVMNMASLWSLPVIYACENNLYGEYTHYKEQIAGNLLDRAKAFDIDAFEVDGQDVLAVNTISKKLVTQARKGSGPAFLLLNTYRYHGHHVGDINRAYYRSKEEEAYWKIHRDPIKIIENYMLERNIASQQDINDLHEKIKQEAADAVDYALKADYPQSSEVLQHVYA